MSTPPFPINPSDPTQGMMQQAQQTMNNPAAQGVPQASPIAGIANHPIIQQIGQALARAMQNIGYTGATPQVRQQGQEMENQKAETMARLAQTGAFQQGELGIRQQMAQTGQQNAQTKATDVASKVDTREQTLDLNKQKLDLANEANEWKKDIATGRLDSARKRIDNQASQFEQTFQLRAQQVGINQAKLELEQQGLQIKQGFLDVANTAVQQRGTSEGLNTVTKLQSLAYEHPILSRVFGLDDVNSAVSKASGAGIPGTSPTGATQNSAPVQTPAPTTNTRPVNKIQAKKQQQQQSQGIQVIRDANGRITGIQ